MKTTITTTTIHVPYLMEDYIRDILRHKRQNEVDFVITGDRKTPPEAAAYCRALEERYGIPVLFMDEEAQEGFMASRPALNGFLPWNCLQRRDVAILKAFDQGAEVIVLIDDDNYLACDDYVGGHMHLGRLRDMEVVSSPTGWYNICECLEERWGRPFFPRGYAWPERVRNAESFTAREEVRCVVNGGFWLGDPDIDAVTRLSAPIDVTDCRLGENFALQQGVYSPFNSQNTAIHRDIVPAYFLCPGIGRFDDIWASYVIERIAWHMRDFVSFGQPLVRQNRNDHDLWADARAEEHGTKYTPDFCRWLRDIPLTASTYGECALELMQGLKSIVDRQPDSVLPYEKRAFFNHFIDGCTLWAKSV